MSTPTYCAKISCHKSQYSVTLCGMASAVGDNIVAARRAKSWSQGKLAKAAGCHKNTVLHAEKTGSVRLDTLHDIARALGVDIGDLIRRQRRVARE